jgi:amino acid adenylation domain-containing protein/non-ribosomal peptide synthase protein (TIGR01720 family)
MLRTIPAVSQRRNSMQFCPNSSFERAMSASPSAVKNVEAVCPLSPLQEGILFHAIEGDESFNYIVQYSATANCRIDADLWERAWRDSVARHAALRTSFVWETTDRPLQVVRNEAELKLERIDWRDTGEEEQRRRAEDLLALDRRTTFNLRSAPLIRLKLVDLNAEQSLFVLTYHHIILDGWSLYLVLQEVTERYEAYCAGITPVLGAAAQFPQFVTWQTAQDVEQAQAWWTEKLAGFRTPTSPALYRAGATAALRSEGYGEGRLTISRELTERLQTLAQQNRVTLGTVVQGIWAVLLSRYTGERNVVFGATSSIRPPGIAGVESMVGLLINTVPVKMDVDPDAAAWSWLKEQQRESVEIRSYAYSSLSQIQKWSELPPGMPLFDNIVVIENLPAQNTNASENGLCFDDGQLASNTNYPLTLIVFPGDEIGVTAQYQNGKYDQESVARLLGHFERCLVSLIDRPNASLSELTIITEQEKRDLCKRFASVAAVAEPEGTIHEAFRSQAQETPDAIAVQCDDQALTYRELDERSASVALNLRGLGISDGDLVGVCLDKGIDLVVAILGTLKAGAAYVPLDPSYPESRLSFILEDTGAKVVVTGPGQERRLPQTDAAVVQIDRLLALSGTRETEAPSSSGSVQSLAYVIYTSGSTGAPKGVLVTHANVLRLFSATDEWFGFGSSDVWTLYHSYAFDFSVWEIWGALLYGGRLVVVPYWVSRSPQAFHDLLVREQVTVLNQTPSAFKQLIQVDAEMPGSPVNSLRWVVFGGEALDLESLRPWVDRHGDCRPKLVNMYGITETTVHVTFRPIRRSDIQAGLGSVIGVPIPDLRVYVLDRSRQICPIGVPGEIFVGGAGVARGYLNRPELTAERFIDQLGELSASGRFYKSGDLARVMPDGDLEYLGRADDQVKINGFRIELGEIEHNLKASPLVADCVVVARSDHDHRRLVAYVIAAAARPIDIDALRVFVAGRLPPHCIPAMFVEIAEFPLTRNGKIDRDALPAPEFGARESRASIDLPEGPIEEEIAKVWRDVLGLAAVSVSDSFFHLGGDSILSIRTISKLRRAGFAVTPKQLFEHPTIRSLAKVVGSASDTGSVAGERSAGQIPLTPVQRWFFDRPFTNINHWNQSFCFELLEPLSLDRLRDAIRKVTGAHHAFYLRFTGTPDGGWVQEYGESPKVEVETIELVASQDRERTLELGRVSSRLQTSLDIGNGPLARFALLSVDGISASHLLVVAHHLIIDGVSWQILLDDLEAACKPDASATLAPTADFGGWSSELARFAESEAIESDADYWRQLATRTMPQDGRVPGDTESRAPNLEHEAATIEIDFAPDLTEQLLRAGPRRYRAQVNELLLAALLEALSNWTGRDTHLIDLEGHGRERTAGDIDLTRSIGWFTTLFPARFSLDGADDPGARIARVKEQLRSIPGRGLGFGVLRYLAGDDWATLLGKLQESDVVFNYLGELDQITQDSSLFHFADVPAANWRDPGSLRRHLLEISAFVQDGRLRMWWLYNRKIHNRETIEGVAASFRDALERIAKSATEKESVTFTSADLPLASMTPAELAVISRKYPDLQDAYGLSPMQSLYLSLVTAHPELGMDQWYVCFDGMVDEGRLRKAWQIVVQRHEILRSSFSYGDTARPHALIHRDVDIPWRSLDWRDVAVEDLEAAFRRQLSEERSTIFDLTAPPLTRLSLVRLADEQWRLIWTNHHLQLDGWSWPMVLVEAGRWYRELGASSEVLAPAAPRYSTFIQWIGSVDKEADAAFWSSQLADFNVPTILPGAAHAESCRDNGEVFEIDVVLSTDDTAAIGNFARSHGVTVTNLIFATWAIILSAVGREEDVVFGAAFSGRPANLDDVEDIVGPFVNDLPVRIRLDRNESLGNFVAAIRDLQFRLTEHQHAPLGEIQEVSGVSWRHRMFDSLLVVQNYLTDGLNSAFGDDVRISGVKGEVRTNYPLTIVVAPGAQLAVKFVCKASAFDRSKVSDTAASFERILTLISRESESRISDVLTQVPDRLVAQPAEAVTRIDVDKGLGNAGATEVEQALLRVWREDFKIADLGLDDSWADLGIQSALIIRVHARIRETIASDLSIARLFEYPTMRKLAGYIGAGSSRDDRFTKIASRASRARTARKRASTRSTRNPS